MKKQNIAKITGIMNGSRDRNRELIRIRDNHTCQICGRKWKRKKRRFDVHHIDKDPAKTFSTDSEMEYKNLITLCHWCHLKLHHNKLSEEQNKIYSENIKNLKSA